MHTIERYCVPHRNLSPRSEYGLRAKLATANAPTLESQLSRRSTSTRSCYINISRSGALADLYSWWIALHKHVRPHTTRTTRFNIDHNIALLPESVAFTPAPTQIALWLSGAITYTYTCNAQITAKERDTSITISTNTTSALIDQIAHALDQPETPLNY